MKSWNEKTIKSNVKITWKYPGVEWIKLKTKKKKKKKDTFIAQSSLNPEIIICDHLRLPFGYDFSLL